MLWLAFSRERRVLGRDSSSCGTCWCGGGDLRERLQLFTPPRVPCAHLTAARDECGQAFHTIHQRPLHSAVSRSPTSRSGPVPGPHKVNKGVHTPPLPLPEDRKPGLGCDLKLTTDTKLSLTLQKLEAVDATTFTVKVILKLSLPCPEVTPAQSLQFALVPVVESCGRACVGGSARVLPPGTSSLGLLDYRQRVHCLHLGTPRACRSFREATFSIKGRTDGGGPPGLTG